MKLIPQVPELETPLVARSARVEHLPRHVASDPGRPSVEGRAPILVAINVGLRVMGITRIVGFAQEVPSAQLLRSLPTNSVRASLLRNHRLILVHKSANRCPNDG